LKTDQKSSGALIGWDLKNRMIFEDRASFMTDTVEDSFALWGTTEEKRKTVLVWDTKEKHFCFVGYNRGNFVRKNP
jgi:hypothetical protein